MPNKMKLLDVNTVELFQNLTVQHFSKKALVSSPFEEKNLVFIVKSGKLRIYLAYEDKEFTLSFLGPGDIFSTHTAAFVQALEGTELLVCSTTVFREALTKRPELSLTMVKVLGDLLKNSISTIEGLAFKDVRLRLVEFLTGAAAERGVSTPGGTVVELGLGTEDIALLVGTTRQTVSQILNDLIKEGILQKVRRQTLLIKDPAALSAIKEAS